MSSVAVETVQERIEASGASCEIVSSSDLVPAIEAAIEEPAVTPRAPLGERLRSSTRITVDPTGAEIDAARTGVTEARAVVAESGSLVLTSFAGGTSLVSVFVDRHVAVVRESAIVDDLGDMIDHVAADPERDTILATGPSATADMGALVHGAHGPSTVHVIIVRGRNHDLS